MDTGNPIDILSMTPEEKSEILHGAIGKAWHKKLLVHGCVCGYVAEQNEAIESHVINLNPNYFTKEGFWEILKEGKLVDYKSTIEFHFKGKTVYLSAKSIDYHHDNPDSLLNQFVRVLTEVKQ